MMNEAQVKRFLERKKLLSSNPELATKNKDELEHINQKLALHEEEMARAEKIKTLKSIATFAPLTKESIEKRTGITLADLEAVKPKSIPYSRFPHLYGSEKELQKQLIRLMQEQRSVLPEISKIYDRIKPFINKDIPKSNMSKEILDDINNYIKLDKRLEELEKEIAETNAILQVEISDQTRDAAVGTDIDEEPISPPRSPTSQLQRATEAMQADLTRRSNSRGRSRERREIPTFGGLPPALRSSSSKRRAATLAPHLPPANITTPPDPVVRESKVKDPIQYTQPAKIDKGPNTSSQSTQIDPHVESHLAYIRDKTFEDIKNTQYEPYDQSLRFAPENAFEKRAEELATDPENIEEYKRYIAEAERMNRNTGESFLPNVEQYLNPYTQHVVNRIAELGHRNLVENILPTLEARFVGSGMNNSSAHQRAILKATRDISAEIAANQKIAMQEGYGQAADIFNADKKRLSEMAKLHGTLGQTSQSQRIHEINALNDVGAKHRARAQQLADFAYDEKQRQLAFPAEQLNLLQSRVQGTPYSMQTFRQQPPPVREAPPVMHRGDYLAAGMQMLPRLFGHARGGRVRAIGKSLSREMY